MKRFLRASTFTYALLFLWCSATLWADMPEIEEGVLINNVNLSYLSTPECVDWNNDNAKDLVVGEETGGNIRLYLNQGTNLNPEFVSFTKIQSSGIPISVSYS